MTEKVTVTETGEKYHRDPANADKKTACGAYSDTRVKSMARSKAKMRGYTQCRTCYDDIGSGFDLERLRGDENRWTDHDIIWKCSSTQDPVFCSECGTPIESGEVARYCTIKQRPHHKQCRSDHSARASDYEVHKDRCIVLITEKERQDRYEKLKQEHQDTIKQFKRRKLRRKILRAVYG